MICFCWMLLLAGCSPLQNKNSTSLRSSCEPVLLAAGCFSHTPVQRNTRLKGQNQKGQEMWTLPILTPLSTHQSNSGKIKWSWRKFPVLNSSSSLQQLHTCNFHSHYKPVLCTTLHHLLQLLAISQLLVESYQKSVKAQNWV